MPLRKGVHHVQVSRFCCIQGAYNIVQKAEGNSNRPWTKYGPNQPLAFPNTAYYAAGHLFHSGSEGGETGGCGIGDETCRELLPAHLRTKGNIHTPYLGGVLDCGMAAILAEEVVEAIRYVEESGFLSAG